LSLQWLKNTATIKFILVFTLNFDTKLYNICL
jgi:hypothetical protein